MDIVIIQLLAIGLILYNIYRRRNDKEELMKMLKSAIPIIIIIVALGLLTLLFGG